MQNKIFCSFKRTFGTTVWKDNIELRNENLKFVKAKFPYYQELFSKNYLVSAMTYNIMYFCLRNWELSNISARVWPLIITLNKFIQYSALKLTWNTKFVSWFLTTNILFKKRLFLGLSRLFINVNNFFFKYTYFFEKLVQWRGLRIKLDWKKQLVKKKNLFVKNTKSIIDKKPVWCFLLVWCTKNNFFVTVIDNKGQTLVNWSGGNSERVGSKQRGTVFSADNAVYEACYLAKQKGVESLAIHVWSSFWLPQIKNCFDGLETSGLEIEELIYRPIKEFGGCRKKKPWRV